MGGLIYDGSMYLVCRWVSVFSLAYENSESLLWR